MESVKVTMPLPSDPVVCSVEEELANLTYVDWDQPDRTLVVNKFVSPQTVTVICGTSQEFGRRELDVDGPADGPYSSDQLVLIRLFVIILGVFTWLYGITRLALLSRLES